MCACGERFSPLAEHALRTTGLPLEPGGGMPRVLVERDAPSEWDWLAWRLLDPEGRRQRPVWPAVASWNEYLCLAARLGPDEYRRAVVCPLFALQPVCPVSTAFAGQGISVRQPPPSRCMGRVRGGSRTAGLP